MVPTSEGADIVIPFVRMFKCIKYPEIAARVLIKFGEFRRVESQDEDIPETVHDNSERSPHRVRIKAREYIEAFDNLRKQGQPWKAL
jgi:hypothetical protein